MCRPEKTCRRGFTLVEIVVVVMILGIIAAIAAPRVLGAADIAKENGVRHSLEVIRTAIDRYMADHKGALPGADGQAQTFVGDLAPYLRGGELPVSPVGSTGGNQVHLFTGAGGFSAQISATTATHAWIYNFGSGEFRVNSKESTADGETTYDQL